MEKNNYEHHILREITPLSDKDCFYIVDRHKTEFTYPMHCHAEYELNFVEHGTGLRRIVGDSVETVGDYDLVLIATTDLEHVWEQGDCKSDDIREITIQFAPHFFDSLVNTNQFDRVKVMLDKARNDLELFEKRSKVSEAELDLKISRLEQEMQLARFSQGIEQVKAAEALRGIVVSDATAAPAYRKDPLENGKLYISDRRIEFNGPVTPELAEYVVGRIYFYNNQNAEYPIFIVIDNSPGGSVAAGYQIMKAMESSKAPVYVVVKSYAASMAAMITTFAERSFCYGNTVLLQHQPSSGMKGNLTQMREGLDSVTRWTRNINDQLAKKMGMTYEEYVAEMYKHDSRGDWSEFGDGAQRWKWVTDVVDAMEETSIVRKNDGDKPAAAVPGSVREYKFDERGKPYVELPTLPAGDMWMIYDPANLYRVGI